MYDIEQGHKPTKNRKPVIVMLDLVALYEDGLFNKDSFVDLSSPTKFEEYLATAKVGLQKLITYYDAELKYESCKAASYRLIEWKIGFPHNNKQIGRNCL